MTGYKVIFKTGKSWELIMVTNLLKEREIPFLEREENTSETPSTSLQGSWSVLVPDEFVKRAKKILAELPINIKSYAPDIWDSGTDDDTKKNWKLFALGSIIVIILGIIFTLIYR